MGTEGFDRTLTLSKIEQLDRAGLLALWSALMRTPVPRGMSQVLMRRFLAFEVQQRAGGGLTAAELQRVLRLADDPAKAAAPRLAPGARFLREWSGVTHVVERTDAGYLWNGKVFASLSAIAGEITGAHWSGPRFFGVTTRSNRDQARPARRQGGKP